MRRSANTSLRKLFYKYYMIKQTKWGQKCVDGMALITKTRQIVREQSLGSAKKRIVGEKEFYGKIYRCVDS